MQTATKVGEVKSLHLLPQNPEEEGIVLPSKLSDMLTSGRPMIATCNGETEIASAVNLCGRCMAQGNSHELANAIRQLLLQPAERARHSALEPFDQNSVLQRLQTRLTTITGTPA